MNDFGHNHFLKVEVYIDNTDQNNREIYIIEQHVYVKRSSSLKR